MNQKKPILWTFILIGLGIVAYLSLKNPTPPASEHNVIPPAIQEKSKALQNFSHSIVTPIPEKISVNSAQAKLGKKLFFDPRLSPNNTIACAKCHQFNHGGADTQPFSQGIQQQYGTTNAPTVFNAVFNLAQMWNGHSATLAEQAQGPLFNPVEMGNKSPKRLINLWTTDPQYQSLFKTAFQTQHPTLEMALRALQAYETTLITPNSRFDQFLKGDFNILTEQELHGYQLFQDLGCIACHNGRNLGSNMFQTAGVFAPLSKNKHTAWPDRSKVTHRPEDKRKVKVPTLRNIIATAPYFHDGSAKTLEDAIQTMAKSQLGKHLNDADTQAIKAFLITLTGQYQGQYISPQH